MPCQSRIDALGALHHIIAGGIKRKRIFTDDVDRDNLTEEYSLILKETNCSDLFRTAALNVYRDIARERVKGDI